jgi:excisionase family DNA binding protein
MTAALSRAAASEASGISEDMLDRAIKKGDLKAKQLGRRVLIRPADLDAYIDSLPDVEVKAS